MFDKIKGIFDKHPEEEEAIETVEEIMDEREERGDDVLVDDDEMLMLKNVFKLRDKRASDIAIPRAQMVAISVNATPEELKQIVLKDKYTRMPVYEKNLDNIVGVLHTKDLLGAILQKKKIDVAKIMNHHVVFVAPSMRGLDLLREMQAKAMQLAVVIDEFGGTLGIITLEDLLEEIVGEIEDEHDMLDQPPELVQVSARVIDADARIELSELEEKIGHFLTHEDKEADIDTIGGLVFHIAGRLPYRGEIIAHESGLKFQVTDVDARRIKKVKITNFEGIKKKKPKAKKKK
ncbi:MAG: HlyC/CorC family transporter [Alphaproteobacteria bacterium]|nr:HlyC/CorC family transporter [Alphaproteobacteria bacterium]